MDLTLIKSKIYEIRGLKVMLDYDLAELYNVQTKNLNLAVKRNLNRFPSDFMFKLTKNEYESLRLQIETSNKHEGTRYLPDTFTEQGLAMLSGILNSHKATDKNFSANLDTVFYNQYVQALKYTSQLQDWVYESYNEDVSYTKLDSLYFSDTIYYSTLYNGRKISYNSRTVNYPFNNTVFERHVDGCGLAYYSYYQHMPYDLDIFLNLVYYRKGNEEWGEPFQFMGIHGFGNEPDNCIIFPNPAKNKIQISPKIILQVKQILIFNNIGKRVSNLSNDFDNINISKLPPGLYIVKIIGDNWNVSRKLIVK